MVLTLRVLNGENVPGTPAECLFEAGRVAIGNSPSDDLTLPPPDDEGCAEQVVLAPDGDAYRVTGGNALEATVLHDAPVADQAAPTVTDGDVLHVGPYSLEVGIEADGDEAPALDDAAETVWTALAAFADAYEQAAADRPEALAAGWDAAPGPLASHEVVQAVAGLLDRAAAETADGPAEASPRPPAAVVETVTDVLAEILTVPRRFREEFVGHSFAHPPEAAFLYEGEGAAIREHLLVPSLSAAERRQRLRYLEEAAEALALHQIAVLDGYKASVQSGLAELLGRVDPEAHRAAVTDEHSVLGAVPGLAEPAVLVRLRNECRALLREDWSVAEQRIFRPAFAKAYLERMTAPHGDAPD